MVQLSVVHGSSSSQLSTSAGVQRWAAHRTVVLAVDDKRPRWSPKSSVAVFVTVPLHTLAPPHSTTSAHDTSPFTLTVVSVLGSPLAAISNTTASAAGTTGISVPVGV